MTRNGNHIIPSYSSDFHLVVDVFMGFIDKNVNKSFALLAFSYFHWRRAHERQWVILKWKIFVGCIDGKLANETT